LAEYEKNEEDNRVQNKIIADGPQNKLIMVVHIIIDQFVFVLFFFLYGVLGILGILLDNRRLIGLILRKVLIVWLFSLDENILLNGVFLQSIVFFWKKSVGAGHFLRCDSLVETPTLFHRLNGHVNAFLWILFLSKPHVSKFASKFTSKSPQPKYQIGKSFILER